MIADQKNLSSSPIVAPLVSNTSPLSRAIKAIKTLKEVEQSQRVPTYLERKYMSKFPGFGSVWSSLYEDKNPSPELLELLTDAELASAKLSTPNAYYTDLSVMHFINTAVERMMSGSVAYGLEPGCGIGNFIDLLPYSFEVDGVELDKISSRLAKQVLSESNRRASIHNVNFADFDMPNESYDFVVGNVPFGDIKLAYHGKFIGIHDYFILKSLDLLRDGGVCGVVTSRFTLDKANSKLRKMMRSKARLIQAFRLPTNAFAKQGTAVVTDVLFFQKGQFTGNDDWIDTYEASVADGALVQGNDINFNRRLAENPELVIADYLELGTGMYGSNTLHVKMKEGKPLVDRLNSMLEKLPRDIYVPKGKVSPSSKQTGKTVTFENSSKDWLKPGALNFKNGAAYYYTGYKWLPLTNHHGAITDKGKTGKKIKAYCKLRDAVHAVYDSQLNNQTSSVKDAARATLKAEYDAFYDKFGPVGLRTTSTTANGIISRYSNIYSLKAHGSYDPDLWLVMAIERYDDKTGTASYGPIFHKDIINPRMEINVNSPEEALVVSMLKTGTVDIDMIAELVDSSHESVIEDLQRGTPRIFFDPHKSKYVLREDYLSGNILEKLDQLERVSPDHPTSKKVSLNKKYLQEAMPKPIPKEKVIPNLGATWIDPKYIKQFAQEAFGGSWNIRYEPTLAKWIVRGKASSNKRTLYGTKRVSSGEVFTACLCSNLITVTDIYIDDDGKERRRKNDAETMLARQAQQRLRSTFKMWVYLDPVRAQDMADTYNKRFNNVALRQYDGSWLKYNNMNTEITLRSHQNDAVYRILTSKSTLLAHATGAGKTFTMIASAVMAKRMGLRNRSLFVVPNHMLEQFSREFLLLFPSANILAMTNEDHKADRRKAFIAKLSSGDYDGIICTHSVFNKIQMSPQYQVDFINTMKAKFEKALKAVSNEQHSNTKTTTKKQLETKIENFKSKAKELARKISANQDDNIYFEHLGVDMLYVDEAHAYKNLQIATSLSGVAGLTTGGSQAAMSMYMKTEYLQGKSDTSIVFATATPIANSVVEMFTIKRYLMPSVLDKMGVTSFDGWASTFTEIVNKLERKPDASTVDFTARISKYNNVPELLKMFNTFSDVMRPEDLDLPVPVAHYETISCNPNEQFRDYMTSLTDRYKIVRGGIDPSIDNALAICTDGRKAALDLRIISKSAIDDPNSKVNQCVQQAFHVWKATTDLRATQMIFCDIGINPTFTGISVYDDVVSKLRALGVPGEEIACIGDYNSDTKKAQLFEQVRRGDVRILLGSTLKMGTGTNVQGGTVINGKLQGGLIALHHLDCPWRPIDMEQRDGRVIRQGNPHPHVYIYRYVTKFSFDAVMYDKLVLKQGFISQVLKGNITDRTMDDISSGKEMDFAEVAAAAAGDKRILELATVDNELSAMELEKDAYGFKIRSVQSDLKNIPNTIQGNVYKINDLERLLRSANNYNEDRPTISFRGAGPDVVNDLLKDHIKNVDNYNLEFLCHCKGIAIYLRRADHWASSVSEFVVSIGRQEHLSFVVDRRSLETSNIVTRINNLVDKIPQKIQELREKNNTLEKDKTTLQEILDAHAERVEKYKDPSGFDQIEKVLELRAKKEELEKLIKTTPDSGEPVPAK